MTAPAEVARRLRIFGRVQGVAYRAWMIRTAEGLGVRGWVRNRSDGSVEALVVALPEVVEALIDACRSGPPAARVDRLEVVEELVIPPAQGFRQDPTV